MAVIDRVRNIVSNFFEIGTKATPQTSLPKGERISAHVRKRINILFQQSNKAAMQIATLVSAVAEAKKPPYFSHYMLYQIYEHIMADGDVYSETETRNLKTLAEEISIVDNKGNESEELTNLLKAVWFEECIKYALDSSYWGHSLIEFDEFDKEGYATGVTLIDRNFVNPKRKMILNFPANTMSGYSYLDNPFIIEVGKENDLGLLHIVGKHAIWKNYSYTDWSRLSEKYGIPLLLLFLDSTDEAEITTTLEAMRNIGSNGVGNLSVTDKAQFLEMSNNDPYKIFQEADNMHSNKISKIITGQSDATNSNASGSFARAETHLSILNDRVRADMRRMSYIVNDTVFPRLASLSPKYKALLNHKFVYKSIEDEKLVRNSALQSTLNPPQQKTPLSSGEGKGGAKNNQSFDFFA